VCGANIHHKRGHMRVRDVIEVLSS